MSKILIPQGRLADYDAALAAKRAELKRKLLNGETIFVKEESNKKQNVQQDLNAEKNNIYLIYNPETGDFEIAPERKEIISDEDIYIPQSIYL